MKNALFSFDRVRRLIQHRDLPFVSWPAVWISISSWCCCCPSSLPKSSLLEEPAQHLLLVGGGSSGLVLEGTKCRSVGPAAVGGDQSVRALYGTASVQRRSYTETVHTEIQHATPSTNPNDVVVAAAAVPHPLESVLNGRRRGQFVFQFYKEQYFVHGLRFPVFLLLNFFYLLNLLYFSAV